MISSIHELLQREAQAVLNIPVTDAYEKAVALIVEQVHCKKGKLVTSGMGKAGQIAMNIATTFCSTGIPSVFLHPSEAQHGDLGILQENDLLLLISNSGKPACQGGGYLSAYRTSGRGLSAGYDSYDFYYRNDRYRRYSGSRNHEADRIYHRRI